MEGAITVLWTSEAALSRRGCWARGMDESCVVQVAEATHRQDRVTVST